MIFRSPITRVFIINIMLIPLGYLGSFEGKDLLPIILPILTSLVAIIYFFIKRHTPLMPRLIGLIAVLISSYGLYYAHFEWFLAQKPLVS